MGESAEVLASREKKSAHFSEYYANRIAEQKEIQEELETELSCPVGEWHHVASEFNAANCPLRLDTTPGEIGLGSDWQNGPKYLYQKRENWPLTRDFAAQKVEIPKEEQSCKNSQVFLVT